jgi:antitoxin (DNA-binding transcriptional repressor) of toxin-antitoxin stability system
MTLIKGGENMPNIKPISDLRNYSAVLEDVTVGSPVYLTKNGHGCYTIMDINEQEEMSRKARKYDKMVAELEVMKMLNEGLASANEEGWIDEDSMRLHFKERFENE